MLGTLEAARREYGDVVRFRAGPTALYAVFHPDGVRRVLATEADRYRKDNRLLPGGPLGVRRRPAQQPG
jgi:hypothetical protein